ncbi:hypothetical protein F4780DRAFT_782217 [Xylariomycetidae sp. FL0641]|nr:hypothetical protein F4780DRAFT_782217 [Xylariomycetidae sp. FL0641]
MERTSVRSLPTELLQQIGQDFSNPEGLVRFASICKWTHQAIDDEAIFKFGADNERAYYEVGRQYDEGWNLLRHSRLELGNLTNPTRTFHLKGHMLTRLIRANVSLERIKACDEVFQSRFPQVLDWYGRAHGWEEMSRHPQKWDEMSRHTPMWAAVTHRRVDVVEYLVRRGLDVNDKGLVYYSLITPRDGDSRKTQYHSEFSETSFELACELSQEETAIVFLQNGLSVDVNLGMAAIKSGSPRIVQALAHAQSASLQSCYSLGNFVHEAVRHIVDSDEFNNPSDIIAMVLGAMKHDGCRIDALNVLLVSPPKNRQTRVALCYLRCLVKYCRARPLPKRRLETIKRLVLAARGPEALKVLVEEYPDALAKDSDGQEAQIAQILATAIATQNQPMVSYLRGRQHCSSSAPPDVALRAAIKADDAGAIDGLVSRGVSLAGHELHPIYPSPLEFALFLGSTEAALRLLHYGAATPPLTGSLRSKVVARIAGGFFAKDNCQASWASANKPNHRRRRAAGSAVQPFPTLSFPTTCHVGRRTRRHFIRDHWRQNGSLFSNHQKKRIAHSLGPAAAAGAEEVPRHAFASKVRTFDRVRQTGRFATQLPLLYRLLLGPGYLDEAAALWQRAVAERAFKNHDPIDSITADLERFAERVRARTLAATAAPSEQEPASPAAVVSP